MSKCKFVLKEIVFMKQKCMVFLVCLIVFLFAGIAGAAEGSISSTKKLHKLYITAVEFDEEEYVYDMNNFVKLDSGNTLSTCIIDSNSSQKCAVSIEDSTKLVIYPSQPCEEAVRITAYSDDGDACTVRILLKCFYLKKFINYIFMGSALICILVPLALWILLFSKKFDNSISVYALIDGKVKNQGNVVRSFRKSGIITMGSLRRKALRCTALSQEQKESWRQLRPYGMFYSSGGAVVFVSPFKSFFFNHSKSKKISCNEFTFYFETYRDNYGNETLCLITL